MLIIQRGSSLAMVAVRKPTGCKLSRFAEPSLSGILDDANAGVGREGTTEKGWHMGGLGSTRSGYEPGDRNRPMRGNR
jgi:hypothetical protein